MNDPFSDLLTEATGMAGCPVCRVLTRLLYDEMCRLQYDGVHDPATRARLRAGGFCADHLWYLFDLTTRRAVAALLAPCLARIAEQVRALAARLEADAAPTLRRGEAALVRPLGTAECIAGSHDRRPALTRQRPRRGDRALRSAPGPRGRQASHRRRFRAPRRVGARDTRARRPPRRRRGRTRARPGAARRGRGGPPARGRPEPGAVLNDNHRRALASCLMAIDGLLVRIETIASGPQAGRRSRRTCPTSTRRRSASSTPTSWRSDSEWRKWRRRSLCGRCRLICRAGAGACGPSRAPPASDRSGPRPVRPGHGSRPETWQARAARPAAPGDPVSRARGRARGRRRRPATGRAGRLRGRGPEAMPARRSRPTRAPAAPAFLTLRGRARRRPGP